MLTYDNTADNIAINTAENIADNIADDKSNECVFCSRFLRRRNGHTQNLIQVETDEMKVRISEILKIQGLEEKANQVEITEHIFYHKSCLTELDYKLLISPKKANEPKKQTKWTEHRKIHSSVFSKMKNYVNEYLIEKKEILALADVHNRYSALFQEELCQASYSSIETKYTAQMLLKKLFDSFPQLTKTIYRNRTFLHREDLTEFEIFAKGFEREDDFLNQIKTVAYALRQTILNSEIRELPKHNITLSDILSGESDIPEELYVFIHCLLKGPNHNQQKETKEKRVESICNSIIFSATKGRVKPSTCLQLALSTKSLTGSRKLIDVLNRMGHCVSYTTTQAIETEMAYGCSIEERVLPHGMESERPELHTHLAFDNYDRFVETASGKDTLHDTVGIAFQNKCKDTVSIIANNSVHNSQTANNSDDSQGSRARRKYVSSFNSVIEPYMRSQQHELCLVGKEPVIPSNLQAVKGLNNIWMMNYALNTSGAKIWFLWNSKRIVDSNPLHNIGYIPNLNSSPTSDATVKKTLEIACNIANDCHQRYIIVTYDLAIAMKAYRIQADLQPALDTVFITLGAFHIQLSFFKVSIIYTIFSSFAIQIFILFYFLREKYRGFGALYVK